MRKSKEDFVKENGFREWHDASSAGFTGLAAEAGPRSALTSSDVDEKG